MYHLVTRLAPARPPCLPTSAIDDLCDVFGSKSPTFAIDYFCAEFGSKSSYSPFDFSVDGFT
jgi:hypothetical protein